VAPFWSGSGGPPSLWLGRGGGRPTEVEVAVVGGGVVGLSAAYWLARAGKRPLLLEAGHLAGRASGRNAGFLLTGSPELFAGFERRLGAEAARAFWELSRESRELLRAELLDSGRVDCRFRAEGSWLAVVGGADDYEAAEAELRASGERLAALGFELEWHEGDEVERASGSPRVRAALHQPRDGGLDPVLLCRGIAEAGGFEVRTGAWVHRLEPRGERIEIVADGGSVLAERVVVALNAYAPALLPWLAREIRPVRGQMLATGPGERAIRGVWYLNHGFEYVRQADDGAVIAGGGRRALRRAELGYLEHPTAGVQGALERFLHETYPAFAERPIERRWAGVMAFTADGLPRSGEAPGLPGVVYAAGFNGHGLSLGFATGRWLARRVLGETEEPLLPPARPHAPPSPLI
jgi:glycine/D-amino acid oxidase-like deaminating enzyme